MRRIVSTVYDFSGMCRHEALFPNLSPPHAADGTESVISGPPADASDTAFLIDCRDIQGTNCYCDGSAAGEILRRTAAASARLKERSTAFPPDDSGAWHGRVLPVNWIDTGDYHYMSMLTMSAAVEKCRDMSVVLFDNHPDMQPPAFGDTLSCGGWLRTFLEKHGRHVGMVMIAGINPSLADECSGFANVKVFPRGGAWPDWSCLKGRKVYISIDKDVLGRDFARTDWDQGDMTQSQLESGLREIASVAEIAGADICGGITPEKGGRDEDFAINTASGLSLLNCLRSLPTDI